MVMATVLGVGAFIGFSGTAEASATKFSGFPHATGVQVIGEDLRVNTIRSMVEPYAKTCITGHNQVLINGSHFADSPVDRQYCSTGLRSKTFTTGTWHVNRSYPRGTKICSKFWQLNGGRYTQIANVCATVG